MSGINFTYLSIFPYYRIIIHTIFCNSFSLAYLRADEVNVRVQVKIYDYKTKKLKTQADMHYKAITSRANV